MINTVSINDRLNPRLKIKRVFMENTLYIYTL